MPTSFQIKDRGRSVSSMVERIFVRPLDHVFSQWVQPDIPGYRFNGFQ